MTRPRQEREDVTLLDCFARAHFRVLPEQRVYDAWLLATRWSEFLEERGRCLRTATEEDAADFARAEGAKAPATVGALTAVYGWLGEMGARTAPNPFAAVVRRMQMRPAATTRHDWRVVTLPAGIRRRRTATASSGFRPLPPVTGGVRPC